MRTKHCVQYLNQVLCTISGLMTSGLSTFLAEEGRGAGMVDGFKLLRLLLSSFFFIFIVISFS